MNKKRLNVFLIVVLLFGAFAACVTFNKKLTPQQRLYAVESDYNNYFGNVVLPFMQSDFATDEMNDQIKQIDNLVYNTIRLARQNDIAIEHAADILLDSIRQLKEVINQ